MVRVLQRWANRKRDRDRILQIADDVEANADFDMGTFYKCRTPGCIAGHAAARAKVVGLVGSDTTDVAVKYLGIRRYDSLFYPVSACDGVHFASGGITSAHAAACLRKLAKTGEIDWLGTKPA